MGRYSEMPIPVAKINGRPDRRATCARSTSDQRTSLMCTLALLFPVFSYAKPIKFLYGRARCDDTKPMLCVSWGAAGLIPSCIAFLGDVIDHVFLHKYPLQTDFVAAGISPLAIF